MTWTADTGAKSMLVYQDPSPLASKAIKYVEGGNKVTISDEAFAGKTVKFAIQAYPDVYPGDSEQDKIDNAIASEQGSPLSEWIEVTFPYKIPAKPTNFTYSDVTPTGFKATWDKADDALSWVLQQSPMGLDDVKQFVLLDSEVQDQALGQIGYYEVNEAIVTDNRFPGTTRGFSLIAFPKTFEGKTIEEKINNAMASKLGSVRSEVFTIDFPKEETDTKG